VDQIDEVRSLILRGSLSQLQMALLLLDNAVELIATRSIGADIAEGRHFRKEVERVRKNAAMPPYFRDDEYLKFVEERAIDRTTERKLLRYFDEKLKFLEARRDKERGTIDSSMRRALSAIHRYRNEDYHHNAARRETIGPVVLLLFEIACDLLVTLKPMSYGISSQDDWSEFEKRFDVKAFDAPSEPGARKISDSLRSGVALTVSELADHLADHLEIRFDEFEDLLPHACTYFKATSSQEEKLAQTKEWMFVGSEKFEEGNEAFKTAIRGFSIAKLQDMRRACRQMRRIDDKLDLFAAYADLEDAFEPIELCLFDLVYEVDEMVNAQVHEARERELFGNLTEK
jgi:hypothetical protein